LQVDRFAVHGGLLRSAIGVVQRALATFVSAVRARPRWLFD
jgi:hypothetical protein